MENIKVSMSVTGGLDEFEVKLESMGEIPAFEKRLYAPCIVKIVPQELYELFKQLCNGLTLFGHIPYSASSRNMIATPASMLSFLQRQGYQVQLSPEYEEYRRADAQPLTEELEREKEAHEASLVGVVY